MWVFSSEDVADAARCEFDRIDKQWASTRATAAAKVRELRAVEGFRLCGIEGRNAIVRIVAELEAVHRYAPKPTVENLMRASEVARSNAKWYAGRMGSHDTEYYSACGYDDAMGDMAHEAEVWGRACWLSAICVAFGIPS